MRTLVRPPARLRLLVRPSVRVRLRALGPSVLLSVRLPARPPVFQPIRPLKLNYSFGLKWSCGYGPNKSLPRRRSLSTASLGDTRVLWDSSLHA